MITGKKKSGRQENKWIEEYNLPSYRWKKGRIIKGKDKMLIRLKKEHKKVSDIIWNLGYEELQIPIRKGYERLFVLREDVRYGKNPEFYQNILNKINTYRYRGQFHYNGRDWDAPQVFMDKEICNPGEIVSVLLQTLHPVFHRKTFFTGKTFLIKEGARTVGEGKITRILNPDFEIPDFNEILIAAIHNFKDNIIEPLVFLRFLVTSEKYKPISHHFFNILEDMKNAFEELEKQGILLQVAEEEYKKQL